MASSPSVENTLGCSSFRSVVGAEAFHTAADPISSSDTSALAISTGCVHTTVDGAMPTATTLSPTGTQMSTIA
eukprot:774544-Prymnesium_polylepis.1